jgi:hypothetical protein
LVNNLLNGMRDRQHWGKIENSKTLKNCTLLDHRLKNIPFTFTYNENMLSSVNIVEFTTQIILAYRSESTSIEHELQISNQPIDTVKPEVKQFSIWESIDKCVSQMQPSVRTSVSRVIIEVQLYIEEPVIKRNCNPLDCSQDHKYRKMLCCLGSSVPCKCVFSKADLLISNRRCFLNTKSRNVVIFKSKCIVYLSN